MTQTKTTVLETDHIRITCYNPHHARLVVSFDHWRKNRNGFPDPQPSGFFAAHNTAFLTIHSSRNDWFLSPDLPAIHTALHAFTQPYDHINTIGFSMGGYGALLFSRALRTHRVVLVSPQSSIFPEAVPFETRYLAEAAQLDQSLETLRHKPRRGLGGALIYDPDRKIDARHAAILAGLFPKITLIPLPFGGHPAMQTIAQAKLYREVQLELLRNNIRPRHFLKLHKTARKTAPTYAKGLQRYLDTRAARA